MKTIGSALLPLSLLAGAAQALGGPGSIPILELRDMLIKVPLEQGCQISDVRVLEHPKRLLFTIRQGDRAARVRMNETPQTSNYSLTMSPACAEDPTWRLRVESANHVPQWVWEVDADENDGQGRTVEFTLVADGPFGPETFICD